MNIVAKALKWYSGLLVFSLTWIFFQKRTSWMLLGTANPTALGKDLGIGVGLALGFVGFSLYASSHFRWAQLLEEEFLRILTPLPFRKILVLGLASGIAEELFFRGALLWGTGLYFSSFLFGVAHLIPRRELIPWAFYAAIVGFIFGCVVEIRQTLLPVILAHSLMNILLIHLLNRREPVH
jgi:membrane protease YdiL (CAAX protease family)